MFNLFVAILCLFSINNAYSNSCDELVTSKSQIDEILISEVQKIHKNAVDIKITSNNDIEFGSDEICITGIAVDQHGSNFRVNMKIDGKNHLYQGRYAYSYLVPALQFDMIAGSIIRESDIYFIPYPALKINANIIKSKDDLIGKAAKANIISDKPINIRDVYNPILVRKGDSVNVSYDKQNISIKISALALENASLNDVVKLKNTRSNVAFTAKVTGEKTAIVK